MGNRQLVHDFFEETYEEEFKHIRNLTPELMDRIAQIPYLHLDLFVLMSPFVEYKDIHLDYDLSYVWEEETEILGYSMVYSNEDRTQLNMYRFVTNPFKRGKGIATTFLKKLTLRMKRNAKVHIYVWQRHTDVMEFLTKRGFIKTNELVDKLFTYNRLEATRDQMAGAIRSIEKRGGRKHERISKTRHDAKKILRLLFDIVGVLSDDNCEKIIESVEREATALITLLNSYYDENENRMRAIDIKQLIVERLLPMVEVASVPCKVSFTTEQMVPSIYGNYTNISNSLVNLMSNSLDAIKEADREGIIDINLSYDGETIHLKLEDNGCGIEKSMLELNKYGVPKFVGRTTKRAYQGSGIGTKQVFSLFGGHNITVRSHKNQGTQFHIRIYPAQWKRTKNESSFEIRWQEFLHLSQMDLESTGDNEDHIRHLIWQLRTMEVLCYDIIYKFSQSHNVRDIFLLVLRFRMNKSKLSELNQSIDSLKTEKPLIKDQLLTVVKTIVKWEQFILNKVDITDSLRYSLLMSYGISVTRTMVFTIDPETGEFLCADRSMVEHRDFIHYLKKDMNQLIRGEFMGDMNDTSSPICLGVWKIHSEDDLFDRLRNIRKTAQLFMRWGVRAEKQITFYNTTYNSYQRDLDSNKFLSLVCLANLTDEELLTLTTQKDDELNHLVFSID